MIALFVLALIVQPLADPAQEARARSLEQEIRCVACENEPISQSNAEIAADMRQELRERIKSGQSDDDIRRSFRERYGDFVLFRPPADQRTWLLWASPAILALLAVIGLFAVRRRRESDEAPLNPEESER